MKHPILLVEDDSVLQGLISDYLGEKGGLFLDCVGTGEAALEQCYTTPYDLILLDVMLPDLDGFTICRELRRHSDVPILFLTARHSEADRLHGYRLGCDDYMVKPFSFAELLAKVRALLNRAKGTVRQPILTAGQIALDPVRCSVSVAGKEVPLAPKEYDILKLLLEQKGRVVRRDELLTRVWGYDFDGNTRVLDNHIKKLRKALDSAAGQVKTVLKIGYRLEVPSGEASKT